MGDETQKEKPQDGLALIIGGLFILALIFAAYNYFKSGRDTAITERAQSTAIELNDNEQEGDLNGDGAKDEKTEVAGTTTNEKLQTDTNKKTSDTPTVTSTTTWTANNYNEGDIKGPSYTVQDGDTLWEIAEGLYGDGSQWTKILDANKADVGFLANGQQSLIVVGQMLVLP